MIKKFIVSAVAALALVVVMGASSASAAYMHTGTLKYGMRNAQVTSLQMTLNMTACPVDGGLATGYFGNITKAAVKCFQMANGLGSDGVVGTMTGAKLAMVTGTVSTGGALCPNGNPLSNNCMPVVTSGPTCPNGNLLSNNCMPTSDSTGGLTGGAGDIIVSNTSADVESDVAEGENNTKVLAFRVEADGSDVSVSNAKVTVTITNVSGSTRLERYVSDVSVWMGSTKVGSASAADFNKDGNVYSKNVSLSGAVIREGQKPYFYVTVSSLSSIDTDDLNTEVFTVDVSDIRFTDGTGVTLTDSTNITATTPDFIDATASGDVKLNITKSSSSPVAQNVKVSDTGSTSNVLLNQFKIKATGRDMVLSKINLVLTGGGATVGEAASEVVIKHDGTQIASNDATLAATGTYAFTLDDDLTISEGSTETFSVYAKINKIGTATFLQGESLKADYSSSTIETVSGDAVTDISGSSLGEVQTFFSEGVNASNFTSSVATTTNTSGVTTKQTYTASFSLTAFGNTYYIPKGVTKVATLPNDSTNGLSYAVESSAGVATSYDNVAVTSAASALTSTASTVGGYYEIADGETKTFSVTIEITPGSTPVSGFYHIQLGSVLYDLNQTAVGTDEGVYTFAPTQNFETADRSI